MVWPVYLKLPDDGVLRLGLPDDHDVHIVDSARDGLATLITITGEARRTAQDCTGLVSWDGVILGMMSTTGGDLEARWTTEASDLLDQMLASG